MKRIHTILFALLLAFCWSISSWAQNESRQLPEVTSTEGREFFVAWLPNGGSEPTSTDLVLKLLVSSRNDNQIRVEFANGGYSDYAVAAGQTTEITFDDLSSIYWDPTQGEEEMPLSKGIRVYSLADETFALYSVNQMGVPGSFSFDGAHILPVEALGNEYMIQTADGDFTATEFVVMSTQPGTTNVSIELKVNSRRGNTQQLNVTFTDSKQIYIVRSQAPNPDDLTEVQIDLSGSTICADQPVAVWSGNQVAIVPYQDGMSNDHAYDQLLPLNKWGKEFIVPATACNTSMNIMRVVALQDGTNVTMMRGQAATVKTLNQKEVFSQQLTINDKNNPHNATRYVVADKPIQVYLYSSSGSANTWYDDDDVMHTPSDPSMTLIPPLEYLTDTVIFQSFNGGSGNLTHQVNIWALTSQTGTIQMDGAALTGWRTVSANTSYSQLNIPITAATHTITAPTKCFSGYAYGIDDGQAYMYPIGYDFTPKKDSLFLLDNAREYTNIHWSEWKEDAISSTEGGWHLDKILLDNGEYLLDSTFVCDSTILTLPIKTYLPWYKVRWEIEGSIQGAAYFDPEEQLAEDVSRPELTHQFHLLPIEENDEPFEDFEVRGILIRKPILCDIPEDKWERDTFNTIVRVLRQYDDTTWMAICIGDTITFFYDSLYTQNNLNLHDDTQKDSTLFIATLSGEVNPNRWQHNIGLGSYSFTRRYISVGGCDSLSTLKVFVCEPSFVHRDTVVCQDDTWGLDYGNFFLRFKNGNHWPIADTIVYDTLRAKGCMNSPEFDEFKTHCPQFNGCDSVMELHLNVKRVIRNSYQVNRCLSLHGNIFEWREKKSDRLIRTFNSDTMRVDEQYTFYDIVKYKECEGCPTEGCDSVRNTLRLRFVSDAEQAHTVHVCQGKTVTYYNAVNSSARYTFDSRGKLCNTPYPITLNVEVLGTNENGTTAVMCEFQDIVTFYVDTVYDEQMTYATICWDPELTDQTYTGWGADHPKFAAIPVTGPGLFRYVDTLKTVKCDGAGGCDSICILELRVGQPYTVPTTGEICDDASFVWEDTLFYGVNYKGAIPTNGKSRLITTSITSRHDTVSQYGCDSIITLELTLHPTRNAIPKDTSICENETYLFYGTEYRWQARPEPYVLTLQDQTVFGCDSSVQHNVTVHPIFTNEREENDTICQVLSGNAYYVWEGDAHTDWNSTHKQSLRTVGPFELVDSLTTVNGCDSIIHRTLVVLPSYDDTIPHMMSSEDTIHWEGRIYAGKDAVFNNPDELPVHIVTGVQEIVDSLHTNPIGTHTCDSIRTLVLKIGKVFRDTTYDVACANCGTYNWVITSPITGKDTTIYIYDLPAPYQQQIYYDSLRTDLGYDSIYIRILTTYPSYYYDNIDADEVCQGNPYIWNGHMDGDNGVTHRLFINGTPISTIPTNNYGTIQVVDSMLTDTIFTNPKTGSVKQVHCDSVHVLTLVIHPTYNDRYVELQEPVSMSSNDTLSYFVHPHVLFVGYDFDFTAAGITPEELEQQYDRVTYIHATGEGTWRDSVVNTSQYGCDSVHYVDIHICEISFTLLHDTIADNDTTWFFGGETEYGEHTLPLVTGETFHHYDDGTPVDYSQAIGRTERQYLFIDTLRTVNGCDSIVHNYLSVFPSYRFEEPLSICANMTHNWRKYTDINLLMSGYLYDSVGCAPVGTHVFDSVYVLDLTVLPAGYHHFDTTLCMNDTIIWQHQKVYYQPGGYSYVEAIYKGPDAPCGEIYHLDLTFVQSYGSATGTEYDTICQYDDYHWFTEGQPIEHTFNLRDGKGNKLAFIPTDSAGDFTIYDSLKTVTYCCDSVHTLKLHITPTYYTYDTSFVLCSSDTLRWQEREYVYTGKSEVRDTIRRTSVNGCDSIHFMKLHFDLSYYHRDSIFLCSDVPHYKWEDINFDDTLRDAQSWLEPRTYHFIRTYQTVLAGCDSTLVLDITIAPNFDSAWIDTICIGEAYEFFGQQLTEPGNYTSQQPNKWGCSTFYYLTLEQVPPTTFDLNVDAVCVDKDGSANSYLLHYTFIGDAPVSYSLRYDSAALAEGFINEQDIPIGANELTLELPLPSYSDPTAYPRPMNYQVQIAFNNGICLSDSVMTYDFTMAMNYPAWLAEQRHGDVIALLNEDYNGGYKWSAYQWYEGDSMLIGQTKPYLHIPTGLKAGEKYFVMLTREGETEAYPTCPIIAISDPNGNDYMPKMGYLSVTPTCIVTGHPVANILSRKGGSYRITSSAGRMVSEGTFAPDVTPIMLPAIEGMYIIQLWSPDTLEEPYRVIKVLVRDKCENCDTSF